MFYLWNIEIREALYCEHAVFTDDLVYILTITIYYVTA